VAHSWPVYRGGDSKGGFCRCWCKLIAFVQLFGWQLLFFGRFFLLSADDILSCCFCSLLPAFSPFSSSLISTLLCYVITLKLVCVANFAHYAHPYAQRSPQPQKIYIPRYIYITLEALKLPLALHFPYFPPFICLLF